MIFGQSQAAALRIDLEKKIRKLASVSKIDDTNRSVFSIIRELTNQRRLNHKDARYFEEMLILCNKAVHGMKVDAISAAKVLRLGKETLKWLEAHIALIEAIDYKFEEE